MYIESYILSTRHEQKYARPLDPFSESNQQKNMTLQYRISLVDLLCILFSFTSPMDKVTQTRHKNLYEFELHGVLVSSSIVNEGALD